MTILWIDEHLEQLKDKAVLCRVDLNVPLDENCAIIDDERIIKSLPTIALLVKAGAKIVLIAHLGRPKGKVKVKLSLAPVAERLQELLFARGLEQGLVFADDCVGDGVRMLKTQLKSGQILLLENVRFHSGERKNDRAFAKYLAEKIDIYVNDAFGAAHRAHASTVGVTELIKTKMAGLLLKSETAALAKLLGNVERPFTVVLGGAKVSDKLNVIGHLMRRANRILIGGAMAYTFLKAKGEDVGCSRVEEDKLKSASNILENAAKFGCEIVLPTDHIVATDFSADAPSRVISAGEFMEDEMGLDIGSKTLAHYRELIKESSTVLWNGPMGVFEWENFSQGTFGVAEMIAKSSVYSVVGGGDSVAALKQSGFSEQISHVSTGGGASLEFLEGKDLPGIAALEY